MDTTGISGTQAATAFAGAASGPTQSLGKDQFLQLLITQLQNQDPLEPTPSTEFVSQLATFSSLEQLVNVNRGMQSIAAGQADMVNSQALNLIGKQALVADDGKVRIVNGTPETLAYSLPEGTTQATLTLYDSHGTAVRVLTLDPAARTRTTLAWDGKDGNGNALPSGEYRTEAKATNAKGETLKPALFRMLSIDGVSFEGGVLSLVSADQVVPFEQILEIRAGRS